MLSKGKILERFRLLKLEPRCLSRINWIGLKGALLLSLLSSSLWAQYGGDKSNTTPASVLSAALVQKHVCPQGASPIASTCSISAVTAGHTIIVAVIDNSTGTANNLTVTDNNSNSYSHSTFELTNVVNKIKAQVFCIASPTLTNNPPTFTITDGDGSNHLSADIREYSGMGCTFDVSGGSGSVTSTSTPALASITTTASDVVISAMITTSGTFSACGCGSFGNSDTDNGGDAFQYTDQLNVAAGSYAGNATLSGATNQWGGTTTSVH